MSITIKDITREAGVSHTSVSHALHNHPTIPSQTIRRVQVTRQLLALGRRRITYLDPPLTTFHQPKFHLGAEAARLTLRLLQSVVESIGLPEPQLIALRGELRLRSSTASPSVS